MLSVSSAYKQFSPPTDAEEGTLMGTSAVAEGADDDDYEDFFDAGEEKPGMDQKKVLAIAGVFGVALIVLIVFALGGAVPSKFNRCSLATF